MTFPKRDAVFWFHINFDNCTSVFYSSPFLPSAWWQQIDPRIPTSVLQTVSGELQTTTPIQVVCGNYDNFSSNLSKYLLICLLTAIGLTPGGSSTVHIYTQTVHRTTQLTTYENNIIYNFDYDIMINDCCHIDNDRWQVMDNTRNSEDLTKDLIILKLKQYIN